jgi:hypothetical protein
MIMQSLNGGLAIDMGACPYNKEAASHGLHPCYHHVQAFDKGCYTSVCGGTVRYDAAQGSDLAHCLAQWFAAQGY